jgi:subtilisin-like proprotein convertase family protein
MDVIRRATSRAPLAAVAAAVCALVVPAAAQAETFTTDFAPAIVFADNALASPYPGELKVEGGDGEIADINVRLVLNHTFPDDMDIAIVSPEGSATVLMSDVCLGDSLNNAVIVLDEQAADPIPDNGPCAAGGTFQPTNQSGGADNFQVPGPSGLQAANLNVFNGEDPNGRWQIFASDDAMGNVGAINGWKLTITTDAGEVAIPATGTAGVASPYPSTKGFVAPDGQVISDLNLNVIGFHHTFPDDVDMLLQGPTGATAMVMSDACGDADMHDFIWAFDDEAGSSMSDATLGGCSAPAYQPSDFGDPESLPAPAPQLPYGTSLSAFDGIQGGDWRLWVQDDTSGDTGFIKSWNVAMTTRSAAPTGFRATAVPTAEGQTATLAVTRLPLADLGPATVDVTLDRGDTDPSDIAGTIPSQLQFARGESLKTIAIPINADFAGENAEDLVVSLSNPTDDALLSDATASAVVTIAKSEPDNRFTLGAAERQRNGTATLPVTIPGPGTLGADDAGSDDLLKAVQTDAPKAGTTTITLKPARKAKRKLRRGKKVQLTAAITYTPNDGSANSADAPVTLKRKRK